MKGKKINEGIKELKGFKVDSAKYIPSSVLILLFFGRGRAGEGLFPLPFSISHRAHGIEHGKHGYTDIGKDSHP
jgi:hypothetical protein